jgi:hypothetical protein
MFCLDVLFLFGHFYCVDRKIYISEANSVFVSVWKENVPILRLPLDFVITTQEFKQNEMDTEQHSHFDTKEMSRTCANTPLVTDYS